MTAVQVVEVTQGLAITIEETGGRTLTVEATPTYELVIAGTGLQGPPGPQGPAGSPGGSRFPFAQDTPAAVWSVPHNLGYEPLFSTVVVDGTDVTDGVDIFHIDDSNLTISFSTPVTGRAAFL